MSGLGLTFLRRGGQAHPTAGSDYIKFKDEAVFNILMSKGVSADGVGITKDDAAKVTSIGTWFKGNTTIVSFDEFEWFVGVTALGTGVDSNAGGAFYNCTALKSIALPPSVKSIMAFAFNNCNALESINLVNENITSISNEAFRNCTSLKGEINLPNLTSLGSRVSASVFQNTGIEKVTSLGKITHLWGHGTSNYGIFLGCTSLKNVNLPDTLTQIDGEVFEGCTALETIICEATTPPTLATNAFVNTNSTFVIYVPDESVDAYRSATNWSAYADRIRPISAKDGLFIEPYNTAIYDQEVQLTTLYKGVEVTAEYSIDSDIATVDANGLLTFSSIGVVVVTATYNGETATTTIELTDGIQIVSGYELTKFGTLSANATYSTVGFVNTNGATSIKWGATGGGMGNLCEYKDDDTFNDYWTPNANPRTVTIKATSTKVKASFTTANLDNAYIYDNTNGVYLWKGKNVE